MNADEFVEAIKLNACDAGVEDTAATLRQPPGRVPDPQLLRLSMWFNQLALEDQTAVIEVARQAAAAAVFGVFCVIDGVRAVEDGPDKGEYEIYHLKGNQRRLLNDPKSDMLHDLFQRNIARNIRREDDETGH